MIYPDHYMPEDASTGQPDVRPAKKTGNNKQDRSAKGEKQQRVPAPSPQAAAMQKVRTLLAAGKAEEAFDLLNARGFHDPDSRNARAVCLLRMGQPELAVRALREISLTGHGSMLRPDVPTHFATNLAAALLAAGNVNGCVAVLNELARDYAPGVVLLRGMVRQWESKLSFWQRVKWKCGIQPTQAVDVEIPVDIDPPQDDSVHAG